MNQGLWVHKLACMKDTTADFVKTNDDAHPSNGFTPPDDASEIRDDQATEANVVTSAEPPTSNDSMPGSSEGHEEKQRDQGWHDEVRERCSQAKIVFGKIRSNDYSPIPALISK